MAEKKNTAKTTAKKKTTTSSTKKKTTTSSTKKKTTVTKPKTTTKSKTIISKPKSTTIKKKTTTKKVATAKKIAAPKKVETPAVETEVIKESPVVEEVKPIEVEIKKEEPTPVYKEETVYAPKTEKKVRYKLSIHKLLLLCLAIIIIVIGVIVALKIFGNKPSYKDKASYTESFFIRNKEGKYALYSDKGKAYTKFIYENVGRFTANHTVVQNKNGEYAIIDNEGKEVVKFGKYNYITDYSGLYKVRSDKGYALINNKGKTLLDSEKLDVTSYGTDYPIIIAGTSDKFYVYMYDGTKIATFAKKSGIKDPAVNYIENYATVFYNKENIVIDLTTKKEKLKFNSNVHYCVNAATKDNKILSYNACASWYETLSETGHKISNGKNVIDLSNKCDQVYVYDNTLICSKDYNKYFITVKKNKVELSKKLSGTIAFVDNENYAYKDESTFNVVFVKKGEKTKKMEATLSSIGKLNEKAYVLYVDGAYEFYDLSGKKLIKKSFKIAYPFDENGLAKVSDNGTDKYLINIKGKKVSSSYKDIRNEGKYYIAIDKDSKKGIVDEKGKNIIDTKYDNIIIKTFREKYYAVLSSDGTSRVYDLSKKKEILKTKDSVSLNEHYIKTVGSKTKYYTYNNKLIFSE